MCSHNLLEQAPSRIAPLNVRHVMFGECERHPLEANGVFRVARQLVREQRHADADAQLVCLQRNAATSVQRHEGAIRVLPAAGRRIAGRLLQLAPSTVSTLTDGISGRTLFHLHSVREPALPWFAAELCRRGVPYVVTIHGRYSHVFDRDGRTNNKITAAYLRLIERHVLQRARFVHVVSTAEREIVRRIAPCSRLELIPNAAYSSSLDGVPELPRRNGTSRRFPIFGFCGRYEIEHKGLDLLLAGFALYRRNGGRGSLELVGTGPAREQLSALAARHGIADAVTVGPPLFGNAKNLALRGWDYFVMASRYDGVPLGALEAALQALPLIVSAPTSLQEHVLRHGSGVPIADLTPQAVCEALTKASQAGTADWSRMSAASFRMGLAIGDWSAIARLLLELYDRPPSVPLPNAATAMRC